ncbi:MAG: hypothetical protein R3E31_19050 [Chloroflexota bacterium]
MAVSEFQRIERKGIRLPELSIPPHVKIGSTDVLLEFKDALGYWPAKKRQQLANITDQRQKKQALILFAALILMRLKLKTNF